MFLLRFELLSHTTKITTFAGGKCRRQKTQKWPAKAQNLLPADFAVGKRCREKLAATRVFAGE